jgi:hypothetical protein
MKWLIIPIVCLQGCAYTVASTASLATTGKSITDHTLTALVPNSDCNIMNVAKGHYYCEISDPTQHYNRSGY